MSISPFGSFDFMFAFMPLIVGAGFIIVFGIFIVMAIRGMARWNNNNHSPTLMVTAKVVSKRTAVNRHIHHHNDDMAMGHAASATTYFATFEVESGDRMEMRLSGPEFGMLAEGDMGKLTFQGTRYLGFERNR